MPEYNIVNVSGVIITTNHKSDGIYLPADHRRHFVAWSELSKDDFAPDYWNKLWRWFATGGIATVASYLAALDLSGFDPKAPPPKTDAFLAVVDASRTPEDAELADALDSLGNPDAIVLSRIETAAASDFQIWLRDRRNRRAIPHRMERCGYGPVRNQDAKDGLWKVLGKRQVIYAKSELSIRDRVAAEPTPRPVSLASETTVSAIHGSQSVSQAGRSGWRRHLRTRCAINRLIGNCQKFLTTLPKVPDETWKMF